MMDQHQDDQVPRHASPVANKINEILQARGKTTQPRSRKLAINESAKKIKASKLDVLSGEFWNIQKSKLIEFPQNNDYKPESKELPYSKPKKLLENRLPVCQSTESRQYSTVIMQKIDRKMVACLTNQNPKTLYTPRGRTDQQI